MPFADVCAVLVREPFHLRPWEIARLTDAQLLEVYFRADPRDPEATKKQQQEESLSYRDLFWRIWVRRGKSEEEVQKLWDEYVQEQARGQ